MSERQYDPAFVATSQDSGGHTHHWVRTSRYVEECMIPGCKLGRMSREWIDGMKLKRFSPGEPASPSQEEG